MATDLGKICKMTFIQHAGISQWIRISQFFYLQLLTDTICATFFAMLVKIGLLIPEIMQGVSVHFGTRRQKSTYHTKYLSKYSTELYQLFSIGRLMYADYKVEIIFTVVEEKLLW